MEAAGQHTFDLIVLGLLLLSGVLALFRGLVREVFALGTWVGATAAAIFITPLVEPWFHEQIKNDLAAKAAAGLSVFCLALLILIPLSNLFAGMVKGRTITAIDRSLGFVFGVVRGLLVLFLAYLCLTWVWPTKEDQPKWLAEAKTRPMLQAGADSLRELIPREQQEKAAEEMRKSKDAANKAVEDARRLQELATPVPAGKNAEAIHYAPEDRAKLNDLSGQQETR